MELREHPLWGELRETRLPVVPEVRLLVLPPGSPSYARVDPEVLGWPYWAFAWPGGQALARQVIDHPSLVAGRKVLSFGAGGGIEAIAAALHGAVVSCTELDPLACEVAQLNAALNGVELETRCVDVLGTEVSAEVLLIGDVCYEPALAVRVLDWAEAQVERGVRVLIGDPGRVDLLAARGYRIVGRSLAPFDGAAEGSAQWETLVYELSV